MAEGELYDRYYPTEWLNSIFTDIINCDIYIRPSQDWSVWWRYFLWKRAWVGSPKDVYDNYKWQVDWNIEYITRVGDDLFCYTDQWSIYKLKQEEQEIEQIYSWWVFDWDRLPQIFSKDYLWWDVVADNIELNSYDDVSAQINIANNFLNLGLSQPSSAWPFTRVKSFVQIDEDNFIAVPQTIEAGRVIQRYNKATDTWTVVKPITSWDMAGYVWTYSAPTCVWASVLGWYVCCYLSVWNSINDWDTVWMRINTSTWAVDFLPVNVTTANFLNSSQVYLWEIVTIFTCSGKYYICLRDWSMFMVNFWSSSVTAQTASSVPLHSWVSLTADATAMCYSDLLYEWYNWGGWASDVFLVWNAHANSNERAKIWKFNGSSWEVLWDFRAWAGYRNGHIACVRRWKLYWISRFSDGVHWVYDIINESYYTYDSEPLNILLEPYDIVASSWDTIFHWRQWWDFLSYSIDWIFDEQSAEDLVWTYAYIKDAPSWSEAQRQWSLISWRLWGWWFQLDRWFDIVPEPWDLFKFYSQITTQHLIPQLKDPANEENIISFDLQWNINSRYFPNVKAFVEFDNRFAYIPQTLWSSGSGINFTDNIYMEITDINLSINLWWLAPLNIDVLAGNLIIFFNNKISILRKVQVSEEVFFYQVQDILNYWLFSRNSYLIDWSNFWIFTSDKRMLWVWLQIAGNWDVVGVTENAWVVLTNYFNKFDDCAGSRVLMHKNWNELFLVYSCPHWVQVFKYNEIYQAWLVNEYENVWFNFFKNLVSIGGTTYTMSGDKVVFMWGWDDLWQNIKQLIRTRWPENAYMFNTLVQMFQIRIWFDGNKITWKLRCKIWITEYDTFEEDLSKLEIVQKINQTISADWTMWSWLVWQQIYGWKVDINNYNFAEVFDIAFRIWRQCNTFIFEIENHEDGQLLFWGLHSVLTAQAVNFSPPKMIL